MSIDNLIDLDALNEMIEEDNARSAKRAKEEREQECQEAEELEAAKAKSLRMAKEERLRCALSITKKESASTSAIPQAPVPVAAESQQTESPMLTHDIDEGGQPMDVEEEKEHREGKAPLEKAKGKDEKRPEPQSHRTPSIEIVDIYEDGESHDDEQEDNEEKALEDPECCDVEGLKAELKERI